MTDPIERIVADALNRSKIAWVNERDPRSKDDAETAGEAEALLLEQFGQGRVDGELAEMIPHRRDDDEGADG